MAIKTYEDYPTNKINQIWITHAGDEQNIDCNGNNDFKLPHMGKEELENAGNLPVVIPVTEKALEHLDLIG